MIDKTTAALEQLRQLGLSQRDYERLSSQAESIGDEALSTTFRAELDFRSDQFALDPSAIDMEARTVKLAFVDESIVPRFWGNLRIDLDTIDLSRLNSGAPVLLCHDEYDPLNHVGVVEQASIDSDRVGRALVRFGRSERAELALNDVKDGIRRKISMGFFIQRMWLVEESEDGPSLYQATVQPSELSFVPVAAIDSVGVGLSAEASIAPAIPAAAPPERSVTMPDDITTNEREAGAASEKLRQERIRELGKRFNLGDLAETFCANGKTLDEFREAALEKLGPAAPFKPAESPHIGLTNREADEFRLMRLFRHMADPGSSAFREAAAFELEACSAASKQLRKDNEVGRFTVPADVLVRLLDAGHRQRFAGVDTITGESGGYLIRQQKMSVVELLREELVLGQMGVKFIPDLNGDVAWPKLTGGSTTYWIGDTEDATDSTPTWGELELSRRTIAARVPISRGQLKQDSWGVEQVIREDVTLAIGNGIQIGFINGTGGKKNILGLLKTTGIGSVAGGTDGAAPTYAHMVQLEGDVAVAKALRGRLAYLTNNKVRSQLRQTAESATMAAAGWVWKNVPGSAGVGDIGGYPAYATGDVPSTLVKGSSGAVCSAIIFGDWSQGIIGLWGGLDIEIDRSTNIKSGGIVVQAMQDVDGGLRQPGAFSAMQDALTASA